MKMSEVKIDLGRQSVVFIGPEGSGKTTIAKRLAADSQKPYISTGDTIRKLAQEDQTEIGDECRSMLKDKRYLDPQLLLKILLNRLQKSDTQNGFILDGGLRTLDETEKFPYLLKRSKLVLPLSVVYLTVPESVSIERLVTGESARKRADDTKEAVKTRLSHFYHQLDERLSFIEKQMNWRMLKIDASGSIEETYTLTSSKLLTL